MRGVCSAWSGHQATRPACRFCAQDRFPRVSGLAATPGLPSAARPFSFDSAHPRQRNRVPFARQGSGDPWNKDIPRPRCHGSPSTPMRNAQRSFIYAQDLEIRIACAPGARSRRLGSRRTSGDRHSPDGAHGILQSPCSSRDRVHSQAQVVRAGTGRAGPVVGRRAAGRPLGPSPWPRRADLILVNVRVYTRDGSGPPSQIPSSDPGRVRVPAMAFHPMMRA